MKYRLWINVPSRHLRLRSNDLDGPFDAEIVMADVLKAFPDAVVGIDTIESRTVKYSSPKGSAER